MNVEERVMNEVSELRKIKRVCISFIGCIICITLAGVYCPGGVIAGGIVALLGSQILSPVVPLVVYGQDIKMPFLRVTPARLRGVAVWERALLCCSFPVVILLKLIF